MSFTKTSEGRVFFKNPDNDDHPATTPITEKPAPSSAKKKTGSVMPRDNTQMQVLMLLKSLNTKLKSSKETQDSLQKDIAAYKKTIKRLEKSAADQESNYIDLEQKISKKQSETSKRGTRVEQQLKKTVEQISEAKSLLSSLEEKASGYDSSIDDIKAVSKKQTSVLSTLKQEVTDQKRRNSKISEKQKSLEKTQADQSEKMVANVAAYVDLTKRVSEAEARHEALDNKIEEARSDYLKLDRKIDKTIEDRNRILRKVERIEQAVLETRDALNAKAMVLLTDQGAVAGVHMPQVGEETLQTDPMALNRRLQEEALMPWWRRPIRIQATSLAPIIIIVLLVGWIAGDVWSTKPQLQSRTINDAPTVSLNLQEDEGRSSLYSDRAYAPPPPVSSNDVAAYDLPDARDVRNDIPAPSGTSERYAEDRIIEDMSQTSSPGYVETSEDHGIKIHKGYSDPAEIERTSADNSGQSSSQDAYVLDLDNPQEVEQAFSNNQDELAAQLNAIEPGRQEYIPAPKPVSAPQIIPQKKNPENTAYTAALKKKISPDSSLNDIAKKIENQAFDGIPEAQHDMGALYVSGHGQVEKNMDRAVFWFTEASQNGVANAKYNLGVLYHQGIGVDQDITHAMKLYESAAQMKHPEAQYNLGIASIEGIGVPYNPKKAASYFEQAADQGIVEAAYNLGLIYENGLLGQPQPEDALTWYKFASDSGSIEAQSALEQLAHSLGIEVNDVKRIVDRVQASSSASRGSDNQYVISEIQNELMRRGLYPGPVDGMIGPMTRTAIENFQKAAALDITGEPSKELLNYLQATSSFIQ